MISNKLSNKFDVMDFPKPKCQCCSQTPFGQLQLRVPVIGSKLTKTSTSILLRQGKKPKIELTIRGSSASNSVLVTQEQQQDEEGTQFFEKLKNAERERINKLEETERKAKLQLERQVIMASDWSRALLTMTGKLKGTEWDPENSHRINFSEFSELLNSNNVQYMEYSNYGQTVSVILPYYKTGSVEGSERDSKKEIVFRRHVVDRMPVDCWNDVWKKLHRQLVNVDVLDVNADPLEYFSGAATAVVWSMRIALAIGLYIGVDYLMRPIYLKRKPSDLGKPRKVTSKAQKENALGSLGKSRAKFITAEETTGVSFDDFAGQEYIKRELQEVVRILKNDAEFKDKGIYCPRGVLLHGPPGTGKTLLAKAIAGEAGLPFLAANGTEFVEPHPYLLASATWILFRHLIQSNSSIADPNMYLDHKRAFHDRWLMCSVEETIKRFCKYGNLRHELNPSTIDRSPSKMSKVISKATSAFVKQMFAGVAASRVKDLFETARSSAPSIIFIDEIDAIGGKRGGPDVGGGGAEREQGLLQILTEMDGFKVSTSQVLVIGATNRLDILDPALLRKGRFDKIIRVGLPSIGGRLAILMVHARTKSFRSEAEKETLLQEIAELTEDFSGAELQNILNEAGILTSRKDLDHIGREELLEAVKRQEGTFETGQEDSKEVPEELKLRLAYREAAIAVLACSFPDPHRPFVKTDIKSINSRSNMSYGNTTGRVFRKKADYVNSIIRACAPRVIEEEIFGVDNMCWISATATVKAASGAEFLILQTGLTSFGKAYYRRENDLVPNLAAKIEALRDEYMRFAVEKCRHVLRDYRSAVETITDILLEKGEIDADEIWKIYTSSPRIPQPAVCPVDEYGALVYAGRWGIHGVSLPGRVTFAPGNVGFATFGAPRPMETQIISDDTWKLIDGIKDENVKKIIAAAVSRKNENEIERPQLLMASHFL